MISNKGIICKTINFHLNKWAIMNNFHCEWNWSLLCILLWLRRPRRSLCMSQDPITWSVIYVMYVQCHIYGQSHFKSCHLNQWWTWLAGLPPSSLPDELALLLVLVTGCEWCVFWARTGNHSVALDARIIWLMQALSLACRKGSLKRFSLTLIWRLFWLIQIA